MAISIEAKRLHNIRVVAAVQAAKGLIVDGHHNGDSMTKLSHVAIFGTEGSFEHVVALFDYENFCLNPVALNAEGKPVLSSGSIGCLVGSPHLEMAERIALYEDLSGHKLWNLMAV